MKLTDIFARKRSSISFEFFPPKTDEGFKSLMDSIGFLKELKPSFVSMTYGAGGSTRSKTVQLVSQIKKEIGLEAVAHLTCVGHTQSELNDILTELQGEGVDNVLALRGDPPKGQTQFVATANGFRYASELVRFIKSKFSFCVGVAGYPEKHIEAPSLEEDIKHVKEKIAAGADCIITQLFFDNRDYFAYCERLKRDGVVKPIIAGIMPITDVDQIKRFTSMCGAKIPAALLQKLERSQGKDEVIRVGIEHATEQCEELLRKGAAGIHFYTLNKSQSTREIFLRLREKGLVE